MTNFIGFSTIGKDKKFTLTDVDLIKRDLLNAFLIRAGTLPGRPEVGSRIWEYLFDPNDNTLSTTVETEVRRIIAQDQRIQLNEIVVTRAENTVRANISCTLLPDYSVEEFYINFITDTQTATIT
jgi:phage baseplate assembly protein W